MEKIVVDVGQHSGASPKIIECTLETFRIGTVLRGRYGRVRSCDLKDNGGFLIREGSLGGQFVRECVPPRKGDPNLGKP